MRESYYIKTPFATPEETAKVLGVRPRRAQQLIRMVEEALAKRGRATNEKAQMSLKLGSASPAQNGNRAGQKKVRDKEPRSASRRKPARGKAKSSH